MTGDQEGSSGRASTAADATRPRFAYAAYIDLTRMFDGIAAHVNTQCEIAMLTNNGSLLRESLGEILPDVEHLFGSRAHASFEFKARKPTPLVFQRILSRYSVPASRAIFIDDYDEFVNGARNAGLSGIHFTDADQLSGELHALGFASTLPTSS